MALYEQTLSQTSSKGSVRYDWRMEKEFEDCEELEDFFYYDSPYSRATSTSKNTYCFFDEYVLSNLLITNIYKCKQSILLINKMGHETLII